MAQFVSFLGTGRYLQNIYHGENDFESSVTRFAQVAILEMLLEENEHIKEICLFVTKEAIDTNHQDYAHEKDNYYYDGLKKALATHKDLKDIEVKLVHIPSEQTEEDLWKLFEKMYDTLEEDGKVFFDITHSFRSIPLVALLVANFTKTIKNSKVKRLFYGNEVKQADRNNPDAIGEASIVDITTMVNLLDWSTGVEGFLETGNPKQIAKLSKERFVEDYDRNILPIKNLVESLNDLHQLMETSRGIALQEKINHVKENIEAAKNVSDEALPQFSKLMAEIEDKVDLFTDSRRENMWGTIKWCAEHGLYQQAYTLAVEYIISIVYEMLDEQKVIDAQENLEEMRDTRKAISGILHVLFNPKAKFKKEFKEKHQDLITAIGKITNEHKDIFNIFQTINRYRNNINHAEYAQENLTVGSIHSRIDKFVSDIRPLFFEND